jgi:hypothetical protein
MKYLRQPSGAFVEKDKKLLFSSLEMDNKMNIQKYDIFLVYFLYGWDKIV